MADERKDINPHCTKPGTNIEWCSACEEEVEIDQHLGYQVCPSCGEKIVNCTYCMLYMGNQCDNTVQCGANLEIKE